MAHIFPAKFFSHQNFSRQNELLDKVNLPILIFLPNFQGNQFSFFFLKKKLRLIDIEDFYFGVGDIAVWKINKVIFVGLLLKGKLRKIERDFFDFC